MCLTVMNIEKTEKFFGLVDGCVSPVNVEVNEGVCMDLRNNSMLRKLLVGAGKKGSISRLELFVEAPQDFNRIYQFLLGC